MFSPAIHRMLSLRAAIKSAGAVAALVIAIGMVCQTDCHGQWQGAWNQGQATQPNPAWGSQQPTPMSGPNAPANLGVKGTTNIEPIYWGSHGLAIPYRWAGQLGNRGAKEVVLYVSQDAALGGAANWQKVSSATPQVHSFQYQAPRDGEYYFAIRTYDRFGSHQPAGPLQAEMRVIVDTTSPRNPLVTTEIHEGVLVAKVLLNDAAEIDPQSLRLYAQAPNQPSWTPIQLEPVTDGTASPGQLAAVGRWRLPIGTNQASIRASVADKAGNRSETNAHATAMPGRTPAPTQFASNPYGLAPPSGPSFSAQPNASQPSLASAQDPFAVANQEHGLREPFAASQPTTPWNTLPHDNNRWNTQPTDRFASGANSIVQPSAVSQPSSPSQPWPVDNARTKPFVAQQQSPPTVSQPNNPFQSASFGSSRVRNQLDQPAARSPSTLSRSVNSTSFEFDYELDRTGQWGVANVELWGTTDGGTSWRRFAIDSDRLSPIHVNVPGEGDYGFKILVESVGGFEPTPPRPGEKPEVMVRVDQTAPRVMIQRAEQGQGYQADRLDIQWSAMEEHPAERPIDLFYSNRSSGPWVPLATSLDNSGRYAWRIQRHLPEQVYLKIEARDEAGNVGSAVTPQMVSISVPQTTGSLRGIRTAPGQSF